MSTEKCIFSKGKVFVRLASLRSSEKWRRARLRASTFRRNGQLFSALPNTRPSVTHVARCYSMRYSIARVTRSTGEATTRGYDRFLPRVFGRDFNFCDVSSSRRITTGTDRQLGSTRIEIADIRSVEDRSSLIKYTSYDTSIAVFPTHDGALPIYSIVESFIFFHLRKQYDRCLSFRIYREFSYSCFSFLSRNDTISRKTESIATNLNYFSKRLFRYKFSN